MVSADVAMRWSVQRVTSMSSEAEEIPVVVEEPLEVVANGERVALLMRLPGLEKELAVGFCVSEGVISDPKAIQLVHHCGQGLPAPGAVDGDLPGSSRNRVELKVAAEALRRASNEVARLIRSGCGSVGYDVSELGLGPVASQIRVPAEVILTLQTKMREGQGVFREAGGVHAAALFDATGRLVILCEDIGRHNALDKVIGYCLLRDISLADKIAATTGRASYEMVSKAVRVGIPILASVSGPTSLAVQVADNYGCTLIGYMRGNRFSIYTHPWRVAAG